jgi:voltage-gated potassium channel
METRARLFGTHAAVWLTTAVALLSFATGVINIGAQTVSSLGGVIPAPIEQTAGFTGAMTGFLMLVGAFALRRGYRIGWRATMVLLPVTALQGVVQQSLFSLPLIGLSVVSLPTVFLARDRFRRDLSLSNSQLAALSALVGAQIYGTIGAYALRDQFDSIETLTDAFYFTIVTASTVGYGDITATTQIARLFSMSVLLVGVISFGAAAATLLGPAIEARFAHALGTMTRSQLDLLEDHVIVLGYGDLTEPIVDELRDVAPFVVVTSDTDRAQALRARDMTVLTADPSDEQPLRDAGIDHAIGVVVATNNDAEDALAILTARQLNPDVRIVAAATQRENVAKLERAGADSVISPAVIGSHLLVQSALGASDVETVADRLLEEDQ